MLTIVAHYPNQSVFHMADNMLINISEPEYNSILRQAVAVINKTRTVVATTVCTAIGTAHWELGIRGFVLRTPPLSKPLPVLTDFCRDTDRINLIPYRR